jgi:hypothetical protein
MQAPLDALKIQMPGMSGLGIVKLMLKDDEGHILHHNFMHFVVQSSQNNSNITILEVQPKDFKKSSWSQKNWIVLDGLKVNGTGSGYFEYEIGYKDNQSYRHEDAYILFEASAKQLFDKDKDQNLKGPGLIVSPHKNRMLIQ